VEHIESYDMKNKDAIPRIQALLPFKANNMFGETVGTRGYAVYSYGYHFPLAVHAGVDWYVNEDKYSPTTGRHQSIVRQAVQGEAVSTGYLKALIGSMT
jgi:hypothetical protein